MKRKYKKKKKVEKTSDFLDGLDEIVYYFYKDEKYIDFQTIMYITNKDKTFIYRLLGRLDVEFIEYQNKNLYLFDELLSYVEIIELLDTDKLGL